jgi:hypothetical protein
MVVLNLKEAFYYSLQVGNRLREDSSHPLASSVNNRSGKSKRSSFPVKNGHCQSKDPSELKDTNAKWYHEVFSGSLILLNQGRRIRSGLGLVVIQNIDLPRRDCGPDRLPLRPTRAPVLIRA